MTLRRIEPSRFLKGNQKVAVQPFFRHSDLKPYGFVSGST